MELATNTFNKGLQMDTHPITLGNDSLSDALNATFVTMNGNEVILQNDMGNRRVDHAYLPAGYQPVGMKEYGGVIYVAAYNPITNRSLIGSFPSPERKMGSEYTSLGGDWDPNVFTNESNTTEDGGLKFLIADTSLLKLTDDNSLHAGDKFAVYSSTICSRNDITNLKNTNGTKAISPKNKRYTLALGILNSQNEFVDITKTLHRWNGNSIIDEDGRSEIYKFNDGYFIANTDSVPDNWKRQTNDDAELLKNRLAKSTNTYAYKLVGPLYLKTTLNHIEQASYNIYGIKKNSTVTLWVESVITYNCPDSISGNDNGDNNYNIFGVCLDESFKNGFVGFELKGLNVTLTQEKVEEEVFTKYSNHSYNPKTNLYTITILKKYSCPNPKDNIINYYYCVPASDLENIYLRGLSEKGSIDTSLLGSGTVKLNGWRFYNSKDELTTLTYNFSAYPEYHKRFDDLEFKFTNVIDSNLVVTLTESDGLTLNNGKNTIKFNWRDKRFIERSLYTVSMSYKIIDTESGEEFKTISDENTNEWFLTTQLFNNCYRPSHEDYMDDFGASDNESIRNKYCTIELEATAFFRNLSAEKTVTNKGKILSQQNDLIKIDKLDNIYIEYKHVLPVSIKGEFTLLIKNEELYPSYILLNTLGSAMNIDSSSIEMNTEELINLVEYYAEHDIKYPTSNNEEENSSSIETNTEELIDLVEHDIEYPTNSEKEYEKIINVTRLFTSSNNVITGEITYYDKFLSLAKSAENLQITNGFTSIKDAVEKLVKQTKEETKQYTGIYMNFHERGGDDYHVLNSAVNNSTEYECRIDYSWDSPPGGVEIDRDDDNGRIDFDVKKNYTKITNEFDKADPSNPFIWLGLTAGGWGCYASVNKEGNSSRTSGGYARIWWKTSNLNYPWALLEKYATTASTISSTILDHFKDLGRNIYICFYKETTLTGFFIPSKGNLNYNYEYNLNPVISFKVKLTSSSSSISGNPKNPPITFKLTKTLLELSMTYEKLSLNSSDVFLSIVENSDDIVKDGINVDTGFNLDSDNKPLSVNSVYLKTSDGKLKKNLSSKITPNSNTYGGKYYGFTYGNSSTYTPGSPDNTSGSYRYDFVTDNDDHDPDSSLAYIGINMVKKNSIDG